ncbi:MAG: Crp/Fnr family transcriptional regulator [Sphingobacteriales bacterium JAD_PAG50586_3]|nr:MAG: Crp/Fnr family transcriptional regulator [Sphingobacteriales bacterium JAD_PAG50586_3]
MDKFIAQIASQVQLTNEELSIVKEFAALGKSVSLKKGEHLLDAGTINDLMVFVNEGILRQYVTDANGNEKIIQLLMDGRFFEDCVEIAAPIDYAIQAIEDCELTCFKMTDVVGFSSKFTVMEKIGNTMAMGNMQQNNEHIALLMKYTPEERYKYVLEHKPELIQRLSVTHLAQYLDMSRETLSRIRSKVFEHNVL